MRFSQVFGNSALIEQLRVQVQQQRVPHAQLFVSEQGGEALALALAYIGYVNCLMPTQTDSCGKCASCQGFDKLTHPDFYLVFPTEEKDPSTAWTQFRAALSEHPYWDAQSWNHFQGNTKKQPVITAQESQQILQHLQLKAFSAAYKTVLLFLPEHLHTTAANKLLKIIEEPQPQTLFVLVSHHKEQILPTVFSRLQVHELHRPTPQEWQKFLQHQGWDSSWPMASFLHYFQQDQQQFYFDWFVRWMRLCFKKDMRVVLEFVEEWAGQGRIFHKHFLEYALFFMRQTVWSQYSEAPLPLPDYALDFRQKFVPFVNHEQLDTCVWVLEKALEDILHNANPKILFLDLCFSFFKLLKK